MGEVVKRKNSQPTHQEFDWFDRHVWHGQSQEAIADDDGVEFDEVTRSVRRVARWMRRNYSEEKRVEAVRAKQIYRLEMTIVNLAEIFRESGDINTARELRMCINEFMQIIGGHAAKKVETSSQNLSVTIDSSIERMLENNESIKPKLLEAAEMVRDVESHVKTA